MDESDRAATFAAFDVLFSLSVFLLRLLYDYLAKKATLEVGFAMACSGCVNDGRHIFKVAKNILSTKLKYKRQIF